MTLYQIWDLASYIAGKFSSGGAIPPARLNLLAPQVQDEWYQSLLKEVVAASVRTDLLDIVLSTTPLKPFKKSADVAIASTGIGTLPTDYNRYIAAFQRVKITYSGATGRIETYDNFNLSATWMLDNVAGSGYLGQIYYGAKVAWKNFAVIDTIGKDYKIRLENLSDVSLQNKAGSGQVEIIERDSTGTEVLANLNNIKSLDIQSQTLTQKNTNGVTWNNSITATDTVFGTDVNTSTLTVSGLPSHTIAAGQVTPVLVFDTIGFAVAGLTTNSIVLCSYGEAVPTADTIACVYQVRAGWLTLMGENGKKINYWIPKK